MRHGGWHTGLVWLCGLLWLLPAPGRADGAQVRRHLEAADRLYRSMDNERALAEVKLARRFAKGTRDEVVISLYQGVILADMGREPQAKGAFRAALLLNPRAQLPLKVSPKVRAAFEQIRQAVLKEKGPLRGAPPAASRTQGAPAEQEPPAEPDSPAVSDAPKAQPPAQAPISAVNAVAAPSPSEALMPVAEVRSEPVSSKRAFRPLPLTLLSGAVVLGGAAGYFGYKSGQDVSAARATNVQSERVADLSSARTAATIANVGYAAAGAAAVSAVLVFLLSGPG